MELRLDYTPDGWQLVASKDGLDMRPVGPCWGNNVAMASAFYDTYKDRVSPLRSGDEVAAQSVPVYSPSSPEPSGLTTVGRPARLARRSGRQVNSPPSRHSGTTEGEISGTSAQADNLIPVQGRVWG